MKHIILGAGGAIGNILAEELIPKKADLKLVSRHGETQFRAQAAKADLTKYDDVFQAVEESSTVYLLAGLSYVTSIWQEQWPKIMKNTIDACKARHARLIFFDNVYMYGKVDGPMTENTPINPTSKKGEIRAKIAESLLSEIKAKNITAAIARSADFYGPYTEKTGVPYILIMDKLAHGKRAQWLVNLKTKHSYTYTGDCGSALHLLATDDSAMNQVWHLPTAGPAITGEEFVKIVASKLDVKAKSTVLSKFMIKMVGYFNSNIREMYEMLYQYEYDYQFDSSKFENHFSFKPTSYEMGIAETIKHYHQRGML